MSSSSNNMNDQQQDALSSPNNMDSQQQDPLSKLPTELLLEIISKDYLKWEDHYNLRRTSSRLSQLVLEPMYQGGDYCIFRMACFRGDLDTLAVCALYDAVPTECSQKSLFAGPLGLIQPGQGLHPSETENDNYRESSYFNAWGDGLYGPGDIVTLGFYEAGENRPTMLQTLLQTNCPPSIVELYLRQVNDEGLVFDYSRTWLSSPRGLGNIPEFLKILFDDMFAPWIFKGDNTRSANAFELYMLQDIVTALRRIDARKVSRGYLDFDRDGVWCWYQLCMAVAYISDENICSQTVDLHFTDPGDAEMINPYFRRAWAPHKQLALARRKVLRMRALESGQDPNGIQPQGVVPAERRWAQLPLAAWDFIL
ncbi:hypothetical protein FPANT_10719 [Fusarium pseudoanthophilum]|uniref:F-box domain-containing protein n=1 Tax=Fusarium pseudoanthophilum TaxID=48495 RepID=A0A8H5KPD9_9HYPO|nr:hypothetical protein FPANT_10719 [Fusarium pseudoanthophilum]